MAVGPDIAIPVGLIVTEAVGRALNHDFNGVAAPEIRIEAAEKAAGVELVIEDNGVETAGGSSARWRGGGFGLTPDPRPGHAAGRRGQISSREGGGTRVVVTFPMPRDEAAHA